MDGSALANNHNKSENAYVCVFFNVNGNIRNDTKVIFKHKA
jgi:hypothetical protein